MLRAVSIIALNLVSMAASAAEPLFVPPFTYASSGDFAVAVMLDGMTQDQLLARGHVVLGGQVVAPVVGDAAITQCAQLPTCPGDVLPRLPASLAVVASISRSGQTLTGHVELVPPGGPPVDVLDLPIAPGSEHLFAQAVVEAVESPCHMAERLSLDPLYGAGTMDGPAPATTQEASSAHALHCKLPAMQVVGPFVESPRRAVLPLPRSIELGSGGSPGRIERPPIS